MRDEWFIRGKVPMTKSEVRTVSLSKLELYEDCEFWDIGAGTGKCSPTGSGIYRGNNRTDARDSG